MKSPICLCRRLSLGGVTECVCKPAHLVIQIGGTDWPVGIRNMLTGLSLLWEGGGGKLFSRLIREQPGRLHVPLKGQAQRSSPPVTELEAQTSHSSDNG